jgi:peptidoglycan/LPS O-acetylase OafA/YrhL
MISQKKYDFVDALRGIAVLLVIMAHTPVPGPLSSLNIAGAYGVQLFFVVSAFTLFLSLNARQGSERYPVAFFFLRRFFRIAPAFYVAMLFYLLKEGIQPWQIITTLLFVNGWYPDAINSVVPGGWSVAVEMTFYLFVPLCFWIITNATRAWVLFGVLMAAGIAANKYLLPQILAPYAGHATISSWFPLLWFPSQAAVFAVGFIVFFLFKSPAKGLLAHKNVAANLSILTLPLLVAAAEYRLGSIPRQFIFAAIFGLLCYSLSANSVRLFVNPLTRYIGKISFSVYLFHFWAISIVHQHIEPLIAGLNDVLTSGIFYVCTTALATLIATITYHLIEKPGQQAGRHLIERLDSGFFYTKSGKPRSRSEINTTSAGQTIPNDGSSQRTPSARPES